MSFLRSVIADARPRQPMRDPPDGASVITGRNSRGLEGDSFGAEESPSLATDQTSRLSRLLPMRDGAGSFNTDDGKVSHVEQSVNKGIGDTGVNVEPEKLLSGLSDRSEAILEKENYGHTDISSFAAPGPDSGEDRAPITGREIPRQPKVAIIPDSRINSPKGRDNDRPIASPETHDTQKHASGYEKTELAGSSADIRDIAGQELTHNEGNPAIHLEEGTGKFGVDETMSSAAEGDKAYREEVVRATAAADSRHFERSIKAPGTLKIRSDTAQKTILSLPETSHRITSSVLKGASAPFVPSYDAIENPTLNTKTAAKSVLHHRQIVTRRAMDLHIPSNKKLAAAVHSAGGKESTSTGFPGADPSKPDSFAQQIVELAKPSTSPDMLRFVPARPFQADLIPKGGDLFHPRAPLRFHERKHEVPKVQIGQIDVIIEAAGHSVTKPVRAPLSPIDLASRNYLRRL